MSELTGRAKNRAQGARATPEASPEAAPGEAEKAGPPDLTAADKSPDDAVVRRTRDGWRVGDADLPDLTSAMVLADLISAELDGPQTPGHRSATPGVSGTTSASGPSASNTAASYPATSGTAGDGTAGDAGTSAPDGNTGPVTAPGGSRGRAGKAKARGRSKDPAGSETSKLRTTIGQLEHALTARIRVEQAIGVLAERHRIQPRQAFEQLRSAARNGGRRVIDIASDVVASATNPLLQLPDELSRPRTTARHGRRNHQTPGVLSSE